MSRRMRPRLVTVLFTDIVGSSEIAVEVGDRRWKTLLETHNRIVRRALRRHGGKELDTAGDGFFAVFEWQAEAIRCAVEIVDEVRTIGLEVRAGLHVGEAEQIGGKVGGVAVHTGARVGGVGSAGQVVVSSVLRDLVPGSGIDFDDLGTQELKGIPEAMRVWSVRSVNGIDLGEPLDATEAAQRRAGVPVAPSRRPALVIGAAVGLAVLVGLIAVVSGTPRAREAQSASVAPIPPNTLVKIDPETLSVDSRYPLSAVPIEVVYSLDRVWVLERGILEVFDPRSGDVARAGLEFKPCTMASADDGVIIADCVAHQLYRVDGDLRVTRWIQTPSFGDYITLLNTPRGFWIISGGVDRKANDRIYELDPTTGRVLAQTGLPDSHGAAWEIADAGGFLWTFNFDTGAVLRIAPSEMAVTKIEEESEPISVTSNGEWVWLADGGPDVTLQIDPANGDVVERPETAGHLIPSEDGVYAVSLYTVTKIDNDGEIVGTLDLPYEDAGAWGNPGTVGAGALWLAIRPES